MSQILSHEKTDQMALPLFQPLRYWTPRSAAPQCAASKKLRKVSMTFVKGFSMKGGFVHSNDGERRLVIAGKIVKNEAVAARV